MKIRIGTRASHLARTQAQEVERLLNEVGIETSIVIIKTTGDGNQNKDYAQIGSQGIFVKELELALINNETDIAVHSAKDLPIHMDPLLGIHAYLKRTDPADIIVNTYTEDLGELTQNQLTIGTSSTRRKAWIENLYPNFKVEGLRGNVPTRIKALKNDYDSIIIAKAGFDRLLNSSLNDIPKNIFDGLYHARLDPSIFIPPAGQGAIAIQCLNEKKDITDAIMLINDELTFKCIEDERVILRYLDGGCNVALGIYARFIPITSLFELLIMHLANGELKTKKYAYTELQHIEDTILKDIQFNV